MRSDLKQVEDKAARLREYAKTLDQLDRDWSHLRYQEDYRSIWQLPDEFRQPFDKLYAQGRQDAVNLKNWFWELDDPARRPTLSSFVDGILPTLEQSLEESKARVITAKAAHDSLDHKFWSVSQMLQLTEKQSNIIDASIKVLLSMKKSNLYREERGETIVPDKPSIMINSYNQQSIIQSPGSSLTVSANTTTLFAEIRTKIQDLTVSEDKKRELTDSVDLMENAQGTGGFISAYQRFMSIAADHIGALGPFLPALAQLLA